MEAHWEHYPHQADMGVRGFGTTKAQAFEQAAVAMMRVMVDAGTVNPHEAVAVSCAAPDDETLLADWLNALLFEMAARGLLFARFEAEIEDHRLNATAWGEPLDRARHAPSVEVKGATYTDLCVRREGEGWLAQCVIDV